MAGEMKRLYSIDTLRGLSMICILGLTSWFQSVLALFPGGKDCWLYGQFKHVAWHGLAIEDLFFPTFLFVAGVTFPMSLDRQREKGATTWQIVRKILVRGLVLYVLGLVYVGFLKLDFEHMKWVSVLGRIGVSWAIAALVFLFVRKNAARFAIFAVLLIVHWACNRFIGALDFPDAELFSKQGSFSVYVDRLILGNYAAEGIFGFVTSIGTAMLGMFTGEWIDASRKSGREGNRTVLGMVAFGVALLAAGYAFAFLIPVNKKLWSSSYVLVAGGVSTLALSFFYWMIDVKDWWREGSVVFRVRVDGRIVAEGDLSKFRGTGDTPDGWKHPGLQRRTGRIAFLGHYTDGPTDGMIVRWRNIRILEL